VLIDKDTKIDKLSDELHWNEAYYE